MYLLILDGEKLKKKLSRQFTSHYVSINSLECREFIDKAEGFTSHYVSINSWRKIEKEVVKAFTSHYVSINSA